MFSGTVTRNTVMLLAPGVLLLPAFLLLLLLLLPLPLLPLGLWLLPLPDASLSLPRLPEHFLFLLLPIWPRGRLDRFQNDMVWIACRVESCRVVSCRVVSYW